MLRWIFARTMEDISSARANISIPGVERDVAQTIVDAAHQTCPYSKAIRGNVDVTINLV